MSSKESCSPSNLSALRYSRPHEGGLGSKFGRNYVFVDLAAKGKRILELGCADGFISRHLTERGCEVTGVELSSEASECARKWCQRVINHDLNDPRWMDQIDGQFDTVLCGDVLEHLIDPQQTLKKISNFLPPEGRVIICLPNIAYARVRLNLLLGKFDYEPTGILDVTHLRFFTMKTARELIEGAGYQITFCVPIVGGGVLTRHLRSLLPGLFAVQMIFVAIKK